jgi:hypothetical protein
MKPIFGVYDKSRRDGKYLLFVNHELEGVALRAYGLFIADATVHAQNELSQGVPWPALHGGFVVVDDTWACVYRFVEARDLSANPRPLNVVLLALVRLADVRVKDWRGVLTSTAFRDLADTFRNGLRTRPASCDHDQYLADLATNAEAVKTLETDTNPTSIGLEGGCAAISSTAADRHVNIVISNLRGAEQFWVHRVEAEEGIAGPTAGGLGSWTPSSELLGRPRGRELGGVVTTTTVDYSPAWRKLRLFCIVVGLPAAVAVAYLAWHNGDDSSVKRGNWYEVTPVVVGGVRRYELAPSSNRSLTAFKVISDPSKDPVEFKSAVGERLIVPIQLLLTPTTPPQDSSGGQSGQRHSRLGNGEQSDAGAPSGQSPESLQGPTQQQVAPTQ